MLMIVAGAGVTAFLSSALMLAAGVRYMPVRYAIASLLGYAVFVWLVRRWLAAPDRREANQQSVACVMQGHPYHRRAIEPVSIHIRSYFSAHAWTNASGSSPAS